MATETTSTKPKKVKIVLPLSRHEQEDVYVAVNGRSYLIKRGEEVEVPDFVAEVLTHSEQSQRKAMAFEAQASANANH